MISWIYVKGKSLDHRLNKRAWEPHLGPPTWSKIPNPTAEPPGGASAAPTLSTGARLAHCWHGEHQPWISGSLSYIHLYPSPLPHFYLLGPRLWVIVSQIKMQRLAQVLWRSGLAAAPDTSAPHQSAWVLVPSSLDQRIQFRVNVSGRQRLTAQVLEFLSPMWETGWNS